MANFDAQKKGKWGPQKKTFPESIWASTFCKKPGPNWSFLASAALFTIYTPIYEVATVCYISQPRWQRNIVQRCARGGWGGNSGNARIEKFFSFWCLPSGSEEAPQLILPCLIIIPSLECFSNNTWTTEDYWRLLKTIEYYWVLLSSLDNMYWVLLRTTEY